MFVIECGSIIWDNAPRLCNCVVLKGSRGHQVVDFIVCLKFRRRSVKLEFKRSTRTGRLLLAQSEISPVFEIKKLLRGAEVIPLVMRNMKHLWEATLFSLEKKFREAELSLIPLDVHRSSSFFSKYMRVILKV